MDLAGAVDGLLARFTVAGEKVLEALYAEGVVVSQDVLLSVQRVRALRAVVALGHCDGGSSHGLQSCKTE